MSGRFAEDADALKVSAALASGWSIHADIAAPYVAELAREKQRELWLPGIVTGEILLAIGMTEPSGGSDLAAIKTTATRDGEDWVINQGEVVVIPDSE